ncbi:MAG: hypothetical protein H6891_11455 [Brucellaceae bacterium]|nr:hypothetical protein [Brucellaceae bacterium]
MMTTEKNWRLQAARRRAIGAKKRRIVMSNVDLKAIIALMLLTAAGTFCPRRNERRRRRAAAQPVGRVQKVRLLGLQEGRQEQAVKAYRCRPNKDHAGANWKLGRVCVYGRRRQSTTRYRACFFERVVAGRQQGCGRTLASPTRWSRVPDI